MGAPMSKQDFLDSQPVLEGETVTSLLREDKSNKLDYSYIPEMKSAFDRVIKRLMHGEIKYDRLNFRNCKDYSTYEQSALRHVIQAFSGETGEDHLAAAIVNLLIIMDGQK